MMIYQVSRPYILKTNTKMIKRQKMLQYLLQLININVIYNIFCLFYHPCIGNF